MGSATLWWNGPATRLGIHRPGRRTWDSTLLHDTSCMEHNRYGYGCFVVELTTSRLMPPPRLSRSLSPSSNEQKPPGESLLHAAPGSTSPGECGYTRPSVSPKKIADRDLTQAMLISPFPPRLDYQRLPHVFHSALDNRTDFVVGSRITHNSRRHLPPHHPQPPSLGSGDLLSTLSES